MVYNMTYTDSSVCKGTKNVRNPNHHYFSKTVSRNAPPIYIAIRLPFVLQYFWCPYTLRKGKYCQYSSHLYLSTPPICILQYASHLYIAVLLGPGCSQNCHAPHKHNLSGKTSWHWVNGVCRGGGQAVSNQILTRFRLNPVEIPRTHVFSVVQGVPRQGWKVKSGQNPVKSVRPQLRMTPLVQCQCLPGISLNYCYPIWFEFFFFFFEYIFKIYPKPIVFVWAA